MQPNLERARRYMAENDVRALLASSATNVVYLTGFDCWLYQKYTENVLVLGAPRSRKEQFAVLGASGPPLLVVDSYTSLFASELQGVELRCYGGEPTEMPEGREEFVRFFRDAILGQRQTPAEAVAEALRSRGVTRGRVAIERSSMRPKTLAALRRALPGVEFLDGSLLISFVRMVKTDAEAELLKRAALINEKALYLSLRRARAGALIEEMARSYMAEVAKDGALFDHYFYSPDGLWLSGAQGYTLRRGEYTIIDTGCTYWSYFGDMGTTLLVGEEKRAVVERYRTVWDAVSEIADSIQPGEMPSEVMRRFSSLYKRLGIPNPDHQGHGIGLEPREYPIMGQGGSASIKDQVMEATTEIPLEVGMIISLETSLYEVGRGSYEVERTFRVGKRTLEELTTKKDRSIFVSPSP